MRTRFPTISMVVLTAFWSSWAAAQPNPVTMIHVMNEPACLPSEAQAVEVQFNTDWVLGVNDWEWDFGNGQQSYELSPVARYSQANNYTVSLTVNTTLAGPVTMVAENRVQINKLEFEDDFGDAGYTDFYWDYFDTDLLAGSTLEFEVKPNYSHPPLTHHGQQNGRIICVNGEGGGELPTFPPSFPPEPDGRFLFDLQLLAEDSSDVGYTAFRLFSEGGDWPEVAALRVRRENGNFQVRLQGGGAVASWHTLANTLRPVLSVDLDWHEAYLESKSVIRVRIQEEGRPAVTQYLEGELSGEGGFKTIQVGVMDLDWGFPHRAGLLRVDNFNYCAFSHRPNFD